MKKFLSILMAAMMLLSVAAACNNNDEPVEETPNQGGEETPNQGGNTTPDPVEPAKKIYKTYMGEECTSLNFLDNVDSNSGTVAGYIASKMWQMYPNEDGTNYIWVDDLADGDPIKVDDYTWQIKLNKEAKFHDGTPINADTWMFTFEQQLNPKLQMRMATFLYDNTFTIVNG